MRGTRTSSPFYQHTTIARTLLLRDFTSQSIGVRSSLRGTAEIKLLTGIRLLTVDEDRRLAALLGPLRLQVRPPPGWNRPPELDTQRVTGQLTAPAPAGAVRSSSQ